MASARSEPSASIVADGDAPRFAAAEAAAIVETTLADGRAKPHPGVPETSLPHGRFTATGPKGCDICGVFWGTFADREPEKCAGEVATLFDLWSKGLITPSATHVFSLSEGGKAIARLAARENVGKIVVSIAD